MLCGVPTSGKGYPFPCRNPVLQLKLIILLISKVLFFEYLFFSFKNLKIIGIGEIPENFYEKFRHKK